MTLSYQAATLITTDLGKRWDAALQRLDIRHPDPTCSFSILLTDAQGGPSIHVKATVRDTRDQSVFRVDQAIHSARLTIWPGERLAALFVGGLFVSYMTHESWELVRLHGETLISPHDEPFYSDHVFRRAAPSVLSWDSIAGALSAVLSPSYVAALVQEARNV